MDINDEPMPFNAMEKIGDYIIVLSFQNRSSYLQWSTHCANIRDAIAQINNDDNTDAARVPLYRQWLESTQAFTDNWGELYLPPDIRDAVNSVEHGIGLPLTTWTTDARA